MIIQKEDKVLKQMFTNFIHSALTMKMTKTRGRGLFATEFIKEGTIIIAEKAFIVVEKGLKSFDKVVIKPDGMTNRMLHDEAPIIQKCQEIASLQGI